MRLLLLPLFLLAACQSTTIRDYIAQQENVREVISGNIYGTKMESPQVTSLKDGKAYTVTGKEDWVVITLNQRQQGSLRKARRRIELKPGDVVIHANTFSYVVIKK